MAEEFKDLNITGKILISVKYDLGGKIKDYSKLINNLKEANFKVEPVDSSLSIFNFSHLKYMLLLL